MLAALAGLDDDALARNLGSSHDSVLDTFAHILAADWVWLRRWSGESPRRMPDDWSVESRAELRDRLDAIETERAAFLEALRPGDLDRVVAYRTIAGQPFESRMDEMLRHVVNHGTYHRGQLATLLRQLGIAAPPTDLIAYYRDRDAAARERDADRSSDAEEPRPGAGS